MVFVTHQQCTLVAVTGIGNSMLPDHNFALLCR